MRRILFFTIRLGALACAVLLLARAGEPGLAGEGEGTRSFRSRHLSQRAGTTAPLTTDPSVIGEWKGVMSWPAVAVHSILLPTGRVLFFRGDEPSPVSWTWDPKTNDFAMQSVGVVIFCAGHSQLPDGRVLVTGGALPGPPGGSTTSLGPKWARIFDPWTETWSAVPDMLYGRYYPTNVLLPDGRTIVVAGDDENGDHTEEVEAFLPSSIFGPPDRWVYLPGADRSMSYYPRLFYIPTGKILRVSYEEPSLTLDPNGGAWQTIAVANYGKRTHGSAVMVPPGFRQIMILGGRNRSGPDPLATATAEILDLSAPTPSWRYTAPMTYRRIHPNVTILPDGKIFVSGGSADDDETMPAYVSELFDPNTETWTQMAAMNTFRNYHSSALLLPDGRVIWAGSNSNPTAEFYEPYYLFRGARPVITSSRTALGYGEPFTIRTPDAAAITSVVLMRLGQTTHSFNNEQRYVPLAFSAGGPDTLSATSPSSAVTALQGYYMLFILNGSGVPSKARIVLLADDPPGNQAPVVNAGPDRTVLRPSAPFLFTLQGSALDDGLPDPPGVPDILWEQMSGPGTVTFTDDMQPDTVASFPVAGTYVLKLSAWDGEYAAEDTVTLVIQAGSPPVTRQYRVSASSDDAEERSSGSMSLTSTDLELTFDSSQQIVGCRFVNVDIPQGARILQAWVQFTADEATSDATNLTIQAQAIDHALTFTSASGNISSRTRTANAVAWSPPPWVTVGGAGLDERTPDIAPVVQEVIDRPGWANGNALAIIFSGTGKRVAESFDGEPTAAPLLHVQYSVNVNLEPESVIDQPTGDRTITEGAGVLFLGTGSDPDGNEPLTFDWDFEGGAPGSSLEDPGVVTFSSVGTFTATFTVYDALGLADSTPDTRVITVVPNQAPDAAIETPLGDVTIPAGGAVHFTGSVVDPDLNLPVEAIWNFGGGVPPPNWQETPLTPGDVRFDAPGVYLVTLSARDALGKVDPTPASRQVTVQDMGGVMVDQVHWTILGQDSVGFSWRASDASDQARTIEWSPLPVLAPSQDATLYESPDGSIANGAGEALHVGRTADGLSRRAILRFDVAGALPAGATVTGATLTMNLSRTRVGPTPVALHRVLASWTEGTSDAGGNEGGGATALPGDVTWLHRSYASSFWAAPGGDWATIPSAVTTVGDVGPWSWSSSGMAADVQTWMDDPNSNRGWILIGDESTSPTSKRFDSRQHPEAARRPMLVVNATDPNGVSWTFTQLGVPPSPQPSSSGDPFFEARLDTLTQDTLYTYRIGGGPAHTFRTPPPRGGSNFWIGVVADIGSRLEQAETLQSQQMIALTNEAYHDLPGGDPLRFVLVNGGLSYGGAYGHASVNAHFNDVMSWSQDAAYMPAWGDEEHSSDPVCDPGLLTPAGCRPGNMNEYEGRFMLPNDRVSPGAPAAGGPGEDWYWFDYGNARFIALPEPWPGAIAQWSLDVVPILAAAQSDPDLDFIVTFGHRNTWSSAMDQPDGSGGEQASAITALAAQHNKMVLHLSAHARSTEITDAAQTGGVIHLRQPGGGAPLGGLAAAQPGWSMFRINHLTHARIHFTRQAITGYILCGPDGSGSTEACAAPEGLTADALTSGEGDGLARRDPDDHGPGDGPVGDVIYTFSVPAPVPDDPPPGAPTGGPGREPVMDAPRN